MECSICGGPLGLTGILGNLAHLQCRNCGMASSMDAKDFAAEADDDEWDHDATAVA